MPSRMLLNVCLDTKIESLSGLEAKILVLTGFYMVAMLCTEEVWFLLKIESFGNG